MDNITILIWQYVIIVIKFAVNVLTFLIIALNVNQVHIQDVGLLLITVILILIILDFFILLFCRILSLQG